MSSTPIFCSFDFFEVFETLATFEVLTLRCLILPISARPSFNVCIVSCYVFKPLTMFGARLVRTQKNLRLAVFCIQIVIITEVKSCFLKILAIEDKFIIFLKALLSVGG